MIDDILLQEIQSLKEQLKIMVNIVKQYAPAFDTGDFIHSLSTEDYQLYLEENAKEQLQITANNSDYLQCQHEYEYVSTAPFIGHKCKKCGHCT